MCDSFVTIWGNIADWVSASATIGAVAIAYIGLKDAAQGAKNAIEQSNKTAQDAIKSKKLDYFSEYSKRYNDLVFKLPINFGNIISVSISSNIETIRYVDRHENGNIEHRSFESSRSVAVIVNLFNLFSDEHYLSEEKMVDDKVWNNWKEGIKMCLSHRAFQEVWKHIRESSIYGDDYRKFIDDIIAEQKA